MRNAQRLGGNGPNMFYRNNSDGTFTNCRPRVGGLEQLGDNYGAIWADYDWDGDFDLYIVNFDTPNMLFENQGGTNNWLQLELIGTTSNFDAIGRRLFDVVFEGVVILDDFDIYAASGGQLVAHTETINTMVTDGQLNIDFTSVTTNYCIVSAIAVVEHSGSPP